MALIQKPRVKITFSFEDFTRKFSSETNLGDALGVPTGLIAPADAYSYVSEFYSSLKNVSDCKGSGFSMTYTWEDTDTQTFGPAPDGERRGVFQFKTDSGYSSIFSVPGMKYDAFLNQYSDEINRNGTVFAGPLSTHLQSIHDKLQNGATAGLTNFPATDDRGDDLSGLTAAYKQIRSSGARRSGR